MAWRFLAEQVECYLLILLVACKHFRVLPRALGCTLKAALTELVVVMD